MWQSLLDWISDIRDTLVELEQYTLTDEVETKEDNGRMDDTIIKWGVNSAVMTEIRSMLAPEVAEITDKKVLLSEVSKVFRNLKLNDLVCSVYRQSRQLFHGCTIDTIENLVRNCYSERGMANIVDMLANSI